MVTPPLDDLEVILLERVSLSNDQLKELAAKCPPQAWYDEADEADETDPPAARHHHDPRAGFSPGGAVDVSPE